MHMHLYARVMEEISAGIVVKLDLAQPVEIGDFVSAFAGLGAQFERFIRTEHPDLEGQVKVYVKEVRKGSLAAKLIPIVFNTLITTMDQIQIITGFVRAVAKTIDYLRNPGGRLPSPTKTELTQIADTVAAIANDPDGKATIEAVHHKKTA